jgi:MSHA biogenesis protein MshQ
MKKRNSMELRYRWLGWMARIATFVLFFATQVVHAAAPAGVWWDANYTYRRQIGVQAGTTAGLTTGYAVSFAFDHLTEATASRSLPSGNDVRVVYWNGTSWVELDRIADPDSAWNLSSSEIWFKTQSAVAVNGTDTNYYLYYGNSGAGAPPVDTTNIFSLFDDFSGATLDTTTRWSNGGATQASGVLTIGNGAHLRSKTTFGTATILEARAKLSSANASTGTFTYLALNNADSATLTTGYFRFYSSTTANHTTQDSRATTTTQTFSPTSPTTYHNYSIARDSATSVDFLVDGNLVSAFTHTSYTTSLRVLLSNQAAAGQTQQYDWVRVRPYRGSDPTLTLAGATQLAPIGEWRLDQKTWNGTAGEVLDSGTNGLHMTSYGSAVTALVSPARTGNPGTCRYANFNGTNQYAQIADNALLDLTDQVTVSVWVYPRSWPAAGGLKSIVSKDDNYEFHLDPNGRVYYWWNNGGTREITSTTNVPLNQWTHIAVTYKSGAQVVYINGVQSGTNTQTGVLPVNALPLQIGQDQGIADRFFNGYIDEVRVYGAALTSAQVTTVMNATHPCVPEADHFSVTHDGYGINCLPEQITVNVLDAGNAAVTGFNQTVTLYAGANSGTWSLISGGAGTLSATTNGTATYQWAAADGPVKFGLSFQQAGPISPTASSTGVTTGTASALVFHPSGFTVTSSVYTPPAAIPAFSSPQTAGTNFTTYITAYGTTATDTQCGIIEAYTGAKSLKFWSSYSNPSTGTRSVTIPAGSTPIAISEAAATTAQSVTFINGQASVTTQYKDAGSINISMKDDTTGNPSLLTGIRGSTGNFVVKPATFSMAITRTDTGAVNPAATTANGSVFLAAGQPFTVVVSALDSAGAITPNFGRESPAESVQLAASLVLPSPVGPNPGAMPALAGSFGAVSNGVFTGTGFSWSEVGIISLTPRLSDGSYMGTSDVVGAAVNVGRFIPYNFGVTQNVPSIAPACTSSGYVYIGQPLTYATAPVLTLTARAVGGGTTLNYQGVFNKLTNTSTSNRIYTTNVGTLDQTGLPANDPAAAPLSNGMAMLSFNQNAGIFYVRPSTPIAPFTPDITLSLNILDSDGVAASSNVALLSTNPWVINSIGTPPHRYGRIAFRNAVGSELLNLPVQMRAEYFVSTAMGFVTNNTDSCTTGVTTALTINLNASGTTCLLNASSCPGPSGQQFKMPPVAGDFTAVLKAPGATHGGTVMVTTIVPTWLQFDWNTSPSSPGLENPSGIATFGLFKGEAKRIFQTEK